MSRHLRGLIAMVAVLAVSGHSLAAQDSTASRARQLARQVDALEAAGDWRKAIAPLDRLLELCPTDPARLRQRGLYAAWSGERQRGVELLRRAVAQSPRDPAYLGDLARVLSWSPATRPEAARTYVRALGHNPEGADLLVGYADLLSWTPATRDSAEQLYRRALVRRPGEPRARVGLANLLAWEGHPRQALVRYDSVLAEHPDNLDALRGRGGALNLLDRSGDAAATLRRALELAPSDEAAAGELARAELARGRYRSARAILDRRPGGGPRDVADSARRATASAVEVWGLVRDRKNQLDANRLDARATAALGSIKLYAGYQRDELEDAGPSFRSDAFGGGARLDHRGLALRAGARTRAISGLAPRQWDGDIELGVSLSKGISVGAGASRTPLEETRRAVQGVLDGGQLRGAVHANLAHVTLLLERLPGPFDAEVTAQGGRYSGLGLQANDRVALETRVGLTLNGSQPWVRLGYGFAASRFDYNADPAINQTPEQRGGYFSPAAYWSHQGIVQIAQRFGARVLWEADARMGREWVRQLKGQTATARGTAVANTTLTIRVASGLDLQSRFLYVNAFDAFEMKEFTTVLKVYFP